MSPPPTEMLEAPLVSAATEGDLLCRCLGITRGEVASAISTFGASTVKEVGRCTGAGRGCMACHFRIKTMLKEASSDFC